jgi:hypothetical protein
MLPSSDLVTSSRFEPRSPPGPLDRVFKVAFGTYGAAARHFRVTRMTLLRWRRKKPPPPRWVLDALKDPIQTKVEEAHAAQFELNYSLGLPPRPPRKLSGCCARYERIQRVGSAARGKAGR